MRSQKRDLQGIPQKRGTSFYTHHLLIVIIFCLLIWKQSALSAEFELSGTIQSTNTISIPSHAVAYFSVSVSNCAWQIKVDRETGSLVNKGTWNQRLVKKKNGATALPLEAREELVRDICIAGTEGEEIYILNQREAAFLSNRISSASAQLDPMPKYYGPFPFVQVLWFAFASGCYFDHTGTNMFEMLPPFNSSDDRPNERVVCAFLTNTNYLYAKTVVFSDPGTITVGGRAYARPLPYNHGFKVGEYSVEETYATNGFLLPKKCSLKVFRPRQNGVSTNDLDIEEEYVCEVTNLSLSCRLSSFRPELPKETQTVVSDTRASLQPFQYTTHTWRSVQETTNMPEFKSWYSSHAGPRPPYQPRTKIARPQILSYIRVILGASAIVIPCFLILAFKRNRKI
jgi:hypothetical protein